MANQAPPHFFDISSTLPGSSKSWSPNTLRTRMVLNYKGIRYTQSFVPFPDIEGVLQSLSVPAIGTRIPYSLPAIAHSSIPATSKNPAGVMNDSWPLALYLDKTFPAPEYPPLFPSEGSQALALAVQHIVGGCMAKTSPILIPKVPLKILDDRDRDYFNRTRSSPRMYGRPLSEVLAKGEALEKAWKALLNDLGVLANMLAANTKGPFFEGTKPGYADFLVASFLAWYERVDRADFERLVGVGNGELKRLWDACLPWVNGQGTEKEYGASKI